MKGPLCTIAGLALGLGIGGSITNSVQRRHIDELRERVEHLEAAKVSKPLAEKPERDVARANQ